MKKPSIGPKQRKAFRDNYLAAIIAVAALLLSFTSKAQTLDTSRVRQGVFANPGYDYIGIGTSRTLRPPQDTIKQAVRDSGAISYKNRALYLWDGHSHIPVGGGTDNSIATGSRTATGDYIQDWANHWFFLNNLKALNLKSNRPDPNLPLNNKVFNFYADSTYNNVAMQLAWGLKDQSNSATDSLHFELNSTKDYTYLTHWVAKQQKYVELDLRPDFFYPAIYINASGNSKNGSYQLGSDVAILSPNDSTILKAVAATSATKMLALRSISGDVGTVVAMDIPTGGSADSSTFATKYGVDTAKANLRTQINGKQPTGNYITALSGDVTASGPGSTASTIASNAVTTTKINNGAVTISKLSATGTPSSSTFHRGDDTWATIPSAPTFPDALIASAGNTPRAAKDSDLVNTLNQYPLVHPAIFFRPGDTLYIWSDSYGTSTGASSTDKGWAYLLAGYTGATLKNYSIAGATLEKRSPTDPFGASNLIDRTNTIPVKTFNRKLAIVALGANDNGANGANYTPTNYKTDYDSVMHVFMNQGWEPQQVLIVPAWWMGYAAYTWYAASTGNALPTVARHLSFVQAAQETATKWGTMYFDIFQDQRRNDTTQFADELHQNDIGHEFIAKSIAQYLSSSSGGPFSQVSTNIVANSPGSNLILGNTTPTSTATPNYIAISAMYGSGTSWTDYLKLRLYYDGTGANTFGMGVASQRFILNAGGAGSAYYFHVNGVSQQVLKVGADGIMNGQNTSSHSTSTPQFISAGSDYNPTFGDSENVKVRVYDLVSAPGKMGFSLASDGSTNAFESIVPYNVVNDWWIGPTRRMRLNTAGNLLIGTTTDNGAKLQVNGTATVTDDAYDATTWNGNNEVPTKNAVRDKIESLIGGSSSFLDKQYSTTQNSGSAQTDLFTYTIPANTLTTNGDIIDFESAGFFTDATATLDLQMLFNGTGIEGTTPLTLTGTTHWSVKGRIIRTGTTTARSTTTFNIGDGTGSEYTGNASVTSLDYTSGIVLKITATAGGAGASTGDILGHLWTVEFKR